MKSKKNKEKLNEELKTKEENLQEEVNNEQEADQKEETKDSCTEEESLAEKIEELEKEIESQKDKYLRLSAEFDNYRKRTLKEKAELILNGGEKSIVSILPVIDDLERALSTMETAEDVEAVKTGVDLIFNKLLKTLGENGVKIIETKGKELNTDFHEAIALLPAPSEELKGKILDCVQTGYTLNDKVIRHAKVVVGE